MSPLPLVLAALASMPVVPFEGEARYDVRSSGSGSGTASVTVGPGGVRSEIRLRSPALERSGHADGVVVVRLQRREDPGRVWLVDRAARAYAAVPAAGGRAAVERSGPSEIGGRACTRVVVTDGSGARDDLCVTHDLGAVPSLAAFLARRPAGQAAAALADARLDGLPVRWVALAADGSVVFELDLRSARRLRVGDDPFRLPARGRERPAAEVPGAALDAGLPPPRSPDERRRLQQLLDDVVERR
jgi:hypothetical protein